MTHGRQIVTTPGTAVQLSTDMTTYSRVMFQPMRSNTGFIGVGGPSVRIRDGEQNTPSFVGGDQPDDFDFSSVRLSDLWLDATVENEGVVWFAE